jgi:hypothetical protein
MDGMFPYTESARRKARKEKALQEGLLSGVLPESPEEAAHPQNPLEYRVMDRQAKKSPAQKRPAAPGARAAAVRAPGARSPNAPAVKPGAPRAHPARNAPARPGSPRRPQGAGGVHVNPERLLLETQALDLFGTGKRGHVAICPDCHHEIVKVVCLGTAVRACLECKGVWLPYTVVRDFARGNEWFLQVGYAIQLEIEKRRRTT